MKIYRNNGSSFTQISNVLISDPKISAGAKGLYCYLLSKPNNWDFYMDDMVKHFADTKYKIKKFIKELEEGKYLERKRGRGEKGQFGNLIYIIYDSPYCEIPTVAKSCGRETVPQENQLHSNTNISNTNISNTKTILKDSHHILSNLKIIEKIKDNKYSKLNKYFNHKINKSSPSKKLIEIDDKISKILKYGFLKKGMKLNMEFINKNNIHIPKTIASADIVASAELYAKTARLKNKDLGQFLYNDFKKTSVFLIYLEKVKKQDKMETNSQLEKANYVTKDLLLKKFNKIEIEMLNSFFVSRKWTKFDKLRYLNYMYKTKKWFENNLEDFRVMNINFSYTSFAEFMDAMFIYFKNWNDLCIGNLKFESKSFKRFIDELEKKENIELFFDKKRLEKIKKINVPKYHEKGTKEYENIMDYIQSSNPVYRSSK